MKHSVHLSSSLLWAYRSLVPHSLLVCECKSQVTIKQQTLRHSKDRIVGQATKPFSSEPFPDVGAPDRTYCWMTRLTSRKLATHDRQ